jgi:hypothetical protein
MFANVIAPIGETGRVIGIGALKVVFFELEPVEFLTFVPLFHINLFPDLIHVNFMLAATDVALTLVHAFPALTSAALACGSANCEVISANAIKKEILRIKIYLSVDMPEANPRLCEEWT